MGSRKTSRSLSNVPNPKDVASRERLDLGVVPDTVVVAAATAFLEGALKYGRYNWRIAGVKASVYDAALRRHRKKWWNGENRDPATRVKHLASIIACAGILLDAELVGKLTDDRPPRANITDAIDDATEVCRHLRRLLVDHSPHQYTIEDGE